MNNPLSYILLFMVAGIGYLSAQTNNPIPDKIRPSGLLYELEEVTTVQSSNSAVPKARINMLREAPDNSGRLFVIDLNGFLWLINGAEHHLFLSINNYANSFIHSPGKGTGFGAFAFHPGFTKNGKLYTTHAELPGSGAADYSPPAGENMSLQWVLTEWTAEDPAANTFSGSSRELLRVDFPFVLHGIQDIQFNPNAQEGDSDYGMLYVCLGDGGSSLNFQEENLQNKASYLGTLFRIDPLGNNSPNGQYGIPEDNPFAGEDGSLGEIYCYGFRNPHRICWDTEGEQMMLIGDIGEKNLEEVNIGLSGANYGWGLREGTFLYDRSIGREYVYPLPENDDQLGFTYPVAQYDHDEGLAIVGGYVYRGALFPDLYGHYIFGDIPSGRVFHIPVEELQLGSQAEIKELNFLDENGDRTTLRSLVPGDRVDLRFGIDQGGEIYFLTKADGKIRKLKSGTTTPTQETTLAAGALSIFPNPVKAQLQFSWPDKQTTKGWIKIFDLNGRLIKQQAVQHPQNTIRMDHLEKGAYLIRLEGKDKYYQQKFVKH